LTLWPQLMIWLFWISTIPITAIGLGQAKSTPEEAIASCAPTVLYAKWVTKLARIKSAPIFFVLCTKDLAQLNIGVKNHPIIAGVARKIISLL